jgi:acyl-CoA synthetase (AMP-forming)/AMP-acid ligase II
LGGAGGHAPADAPRETDAPTAEGDAEAGGQIAAEGDAEADGQIAAEGDAEAGGQIAAEGDGEADGQIADEGDAVADDQIAVEGDAVADGPKAEEKPLAETPEAWSDPATEPPAESGDASGVAAVAEAGDASGVAAVAEAAAEAAIEASLEADPTVAVPEDGAFPETGQAPAPASPTASHSLSGVSPAADVPLKTTSVEVSVPAPGPADAGAPAGAAGRRIFNTGSLLTRAALESPDLPAVISPAFPDYRGRSSMTLAELDRASSAVASALTEEGFDPGDRAALAVGPGPDFHVLVYALFKAGVIPVIVDPGMGIRRAVACLADARPQGLVGGARAHLLSLVFSGAFKGLRKRVTVGRPWGWGGARYAAMRERPGPPRPTAETAETDPAAILFTSGSTGPAKGVVYTHAMFRAQVESIRGAFGLKEGGTELVTFPLFGLFCPVLKITAAVADMDPVRPGNADPKKIVLSIARHGADSLFASPALLANIAAHLKARGATLPGLRTVICAGAPVRPAVVADMKSVLPPEARLYTPYGATEGMPLTAVEADEIANARGMSEQGFGICVGRPVEGCDVRVIAVSDRPVNGFSEKDMLPQGEVGELVAQGPVVAESYFDLPQANALSMTLGPDGGPWRRMGDTGWRDARGRVWFCGRKDQRVTAENGPLFTIPCESVFNNHPLVARSALVGIGEPGFQHPVVVIEPAGKLSRERWKALVRELATLAKSNPRTKGIATFLRKDSFPVDIRHNAKIGREKLALWARRELASGRQPCSWREDRA